MSKTVTVVDVLAKARQDIGVCAESSEWDHQKDRRDEFGFLYSVCVHFFIGMAAEALGTQSVADVACQRYEAARNEDRFAFGRKHGCNPRPYQDALGRAIEACIAEGK